MRFAVVGLVVLFSGCVTIGPGRPLTQLPPGVSWCGNGPVAVTTPDEGTCHPSFELIAPSLVDSCGWILSTDLSITRIPWRGSVVFELTSDAQGFVTDACVDGGNFGEATQYVGCLLEAIKSKARIPQNQKRVQWTLTYIRD